jgi:restriction system protein
LLSLTLSLTSNQGIDRKFLEQFPEFVQFQSRSSHSEEQTAIQEEPTHTPEEILEASYQNLRNDLSQELIDRVMQCSPRFFEKLVVDLLVAMGYGGSRKDAGQAIGQTGDGGVDGIIKEDRLGLDIVFIQAKRWESTVGRPVVQAFAGSLEGFRARKGVLLTTSTFTKDARDYVERIEKKIVLIDGEQLAQLMIDYGIGVTEVATYSVKKADLDYFGGDEL